jgi:hypothetical protein
VVESIELGVTGVGPVEAREVLVFRFNSILHEFRLIAYLGLGSQKCDSPGFTSLSLLVRFVVPAPDAGLFLFETLGLPGEEGADSPAVGTFLPGLISVVDPADLPVVDHRQSAVGLVAVTKHALNRFKFPVKTVMSGAGLQTIFGLAPIVTVPE